MIQAIGAIGGNSNLNNPEYVRILQELKQLNIRPTGDINVDKARLEVEKQKLAQKIEEKIEDKNIPAQNNEMAERSQMEIQKLGAMTVAELNKILHGLA